MSLSKVGSIVFDNNLQEAYRKILRGVPKANIRALNKEPDMSYREKLAALYFGIEEALGRITTCLEMCEDHPADISREDANSVRDFLKESDVVMKGSFELFVGMSEQ